MYRIYRHTQNSGPNFSKIYFGRRNFSLKFLHRFNPVVTTGFGTVLTCNGLAPLWLFFMLNLTLDFLLHEDNISG